MQEVRPQAVLTLNVLCSACLSCLTMCTQHSRLPSAPLSKALTALLHVPWMLPGVKAGLTSGEQRMHGQQPQRTQGPAVLSARRFSNCQASTKRRC